MTWGIDNDYGPPVHPDIQKAQFDHVEYPRILQRAREVDRKRLERYARKAGVDVETFIAMLAHEEEQSAAVS